MPGEEGRASGVIGIAAALLAWLVILSLVLVVSAVIGAELARHPEGLEPEQVSGRAEDGRR